MAAASRRNSSFLYRDITEQIIDKATYDSLRDSESDAFVASINSIILKRESSSDYQRSDRLAPKRMMQSEISQRLLRPDKKLIKNNKNVQELTINKLRYDQIGLVGRQEEIATLKNCIQRLVSESDDHQVKKELIFIKGYSGVGKSTLAVTLDEYGLSSTGRKMFVRGKFDLNNNDEPYSGIAEAIRGILKIIIRSTDDEDGSPAIKKTIGQKLISELGGDVNLLSKVIPEIKEIAQTSIVLAENFDYEAGQERWKYAFRVLIRTLNSYFSPLIIVFDDLQWADVSSLEVIDFLLSDTENTKELMIVGCYRSNEVDDMHILTSKIHDLEEKKIEVGFNVTEISLRSFEIEEVNKIIMAILSIDDEACTRGLAEICFKRTHGNPFFLLEFITMLEEEELLSFNLGMMKWIWEASTIEDATMSTSNVVHLLQEKMKKLPRKPQRLLQYAACLGASFDHSLLTLVWYKHAMLNAGTLIEQKQDMTMMLLSLAEKDFIECRGVGEYRWVHDKVQEAALSFGDANNSSFQFEIGSILYNSLPEKALEESLFDVVNLINKGNANRKPKYAELNLRAAEKAQNISAFHSSTKYVAKGICFLPNNKWKSYPDLTLQLYTVGAQVELALGHVEAMERYSNEVLSEKSCSIIDKVPVYEAMLHKLSNIDLKYSDTIEYCVNVLKKFDITMVRSRVTLPIKAIKSLYQTVRIAKNTPIDAFCPPKMMTDPKSEAVMHFLFRLLYASYLSKNDFLLVRSTTRMVKLTLNHGVSALSGPAYATLALLTVAVLKDFETGAFFADTALLIQKSVQSKYAESITLFSCYSFSLNWSQPLQCCFKPFVEAYSAGMRSGNTEYAMWSLIVHGIFLPYQLGKPLHTILAKCSTCTSQTAEVKQQDQLIFVAVFWQVFLNLTGQSDDPKVLEGEKFNSDKFELRTSLHEAIVNLANLELFVIFGDFKKAAKLAIRVGDSFLLAFPGFMLGQIETFHRGLALYAMARKTRSFKYIRKANKIRKTINNWVEKGNPNVMHYRSSLNAEQAVLDKNYKEAARLYTEAIRTAARLGCLCDAALINERFADFSRHVHVDKDEAKYRIGETIRFYKDWGADAKVKILTEDNS